MVGISWDDRNEAGNKSFDWAPHKQTKTRAALFDCCGKAAKQRERQRSARQRHRAIPPASTTMDGDCFRLVGWLVGGLEVLCCTGLLLPAVQDSEDSEIQTVVDWSANVSTQYYSTFKNLPKRKHRNNVSRYGTISVGITIRIGSLCLLTNTLVTFYVFL